jgi:hypothetical protein
MKWIEKHWILTVVILLAVVYLYSTYGAALTSGSSSSSTS